MGGSGLNMSSSVTGGCKGASVMGVTLFNISAESGSSFSNHSSSVVVIDVSGTGGSIGLVSILHSDCITVSKRNGRGVARTCTCNKTRLTVGALGRGFGVGVASCTAVGFCGLTRTVSVLNKVSVSVARSRHLRLGGVNSSSGPGFRCIRGSNVIRLANRRTSICSHVEGHSSSGTHISERGGIVRYLVSGTEGVDPAGCTSLMGTNVTLYRASVSISRILSFTPVLSGSVAVRAVIIPNSRSGTMNNVCSNT